MIIGHEVARALGVPFRFCERDGTQMALRRGFAIASGERRDRRGRGDDGQIDARDGGPRPCLWARVVAIGSIIDRSGSRHGFEVPYVSLLGLDLPAYEAGACRTLPRRQRGDQAGSRPMPAS
ncbi:MAG: hypothetical protein R2862_09375 [Thermoanaerobaculia bacterium]